jgi:hypothetical protein
MWGEKTQPSFALPSEAVANCVPGAQRVIMQNVNHNGPVRDPDAFSATVLEFLAKRQGFWFWALIGAVHEVAYAASIESSRSLASIESYGGLCAQPWGSLEIPGHVARAAQVIE